MRDAPAVFGALLLDLDDTLYDRDAAFGRWARARVGIGDDKHLLHWLRVVDDRGREARTVLASAITARLGVDTDPEQFHFELAQYVEPEAGAREAIERLARTRRVAIVAGSGDAQREKLRAAGLEGAAHAVFVPGELGVAKSEAYARARRWSEVPAGGCLVIGDDPKTDIETAEALGTESAWRVRGTWPAGRPLPRHRLRSISELEAIA
jgi:putative hydrolase of the HAD superfamily